MPGKNTWKTVPGGNTCSKGSGEAVAFLSHAARQLNFVDGMRQVGLGQDVQLPQIAVVGSQSVGKSSLLERLSGINFPRDDGLCTRMATIITMRKSEKYSAEVSIIPTTNFEWEGKKVESCLLTNPTNVGEAISAITQQLADADKAIVTDKSIQIAVSDRDLPDLTLVDLPGLIKTAEDGQEKDMPQQIEALVSSWLEQANTIALVVVPCDDNLANHGAFGLAKKYDPEGKRTIGVMTKPDLVNPGSELKVVDAIEGSLVDIKLNLGYVIVRNQSAKELREGQDNPRKARNEATRVENVFFSTHEHFKRINQANRGINSLSNHAMEVLVAQIDTFMPTIQGVLRDKLRDTHSLIDRLGAPPPTQRWEETQLWLKIMRDVGQRMRGLAEQGDLVQALRSLTEEYNKLIHSSQPKFTDHLKSYIFLPQSSYRSELKLDLKCLSPSDSSKTTILTEEAASKVFDAEQMKKLRNLNVGSSIDITYNDVPGKLTAEPSFKQHVADMMRKYRGRELIGFYSFQAFEQIMRSFIQKWKQPTQNLLHKSFNLLERVVADEVTASIPGTFPVLKSVVLSTMEATLAAQRKSVNSSIVVLDELEIRASTVNDYFVETISSLRGERFQRELNKVINKNSLDKITQRQAYTLAMSVISKLTKVSSDESAMVVTDFCDMIQAYWKVVSKRYIDYVAQAIDRAFLKELEEKMLASFERRLMGDTDDVDESKQRSSWFKPSKEIQQKMIALNKKKDRLEKGLEVVKKYQGF